ncbi:hypothetical protein VSS74_11980 [Conexibacter stalactiti]|uniref:Uncharacterized protein n=1 Tax=Conexibacter stalactiti TaxID=1940611 RepID=A0ABU4HP36_9ACTN|nr:hypothetical protein [Conexibacter stalactiti]MDW5595063.1 hypothetical protein [Conexibacter stalactiti]MEC5035705.1 hypothetical protein [Conexibacter stalactiti]
MNSALGAPVVSAGRSLDWLSATARMTPTISSRVASGPMKAAARRCRTSAEPAIGQWAYSRQTSALAGYLQTAEIDWSLPAAPAATNLVAPAPQSDGREENAVLTIFPPDLIEADPLGSDLEVDVFVVRSQTDAQLFLQLRSPRAAERLAGAKRRLAEGDTEALAQALTSCRRALSALADDLYPPRDHPVQDRGGRLRKVGEEEVVNRLLMFLSDEIEGRRPRRLATASIESTAKSLDALIGQLGKGVHADVLRAEAHAAYVETWSFIAHVARLTRS